MNYTGYELMFFMLFYAFIGWCVEVLVMTFRTGRFCNRGMLHMPLCLPYGAAMTTLLVMIPTLKGNPVMQILAFYFVVTICIRVAGEVSVLVSGTDIWNHKRYSFSNVGWRSVLFTAAWAAVAWGMMTLIHPLVFILSQIIPVNILKIAIRVLCLIVLADMFTSGIELRYGGKKHRTSRLEQNLKEQKERIGNRLVNMFWRRLQRAYPNLQVGTEETVLKEAEEQKIVFAHGLCLYKLWWVFLISSLCGDGIETIYCRLKGGTWMLRSSVLYGPFSVVWGIGATLLTLMLYRLADKEDRYIFVGGFFVGGTYEYMASLILEKLLGTRFWDYSNMPFNLNGRTNLLYCIFWGLLGVFWIKICYPRMSSWIEKIRPITGAIITWVLIALMVCDLAISGLAILRYVGRANAQTADNSIEKFLDANYPDAMIERAWPNLVIPEQGSTGADPT